MSWLYTLLGHKNMGLLMLSGKAYTLLTDGQRLPRKGGSSQTSCLIQGEFGLDWPNGF